MSRGRNSARQELRGTLRARFVVGATAHEIADTGRSAGLMPIPTFKWASYADLALSVIIWILVVVALHGTARCLHYRPPPRARHTPVRTLCRPASRARSRMTKVQ